MLDLEFGRDETLGSGTGLADSEAAEVGQAGEVPQGFIVKLMAILGAEGDDAFDIGDGGGSRVSDATMEKLAATVQQITNDTLVLGFGREVCTSILGRSYDQPSGYESPSIEQMANQLRATEALIRKETEKLYPEKALVMNGAGQSMNENAPKLQEKDDPVLIALKKRKANLENRIASGESFMNPIVQTCINLLQEDISTAKANIDNAKLYSTKYWEVMNVISGKIEGNLDANGFATAVTAFNGGSVTIKTPVIAEPALLVKSDKKKCEGKDNKSKKCTDQTDSGKDAAKTPSAMMETIITGKPSAPADINDGKGNQGSSSTKLNEPLSTKFPPK